MGKLDSRIATVILMDFAQSVEADSRPEDPVGALRDMAGFIPLKRLYDIEEIGDPMAFLASDEAKYITGTEMVIDGGSTLPETSAFSTPEPRRGFQALGFNTVP